MPIDLYGRYYTATEAAKKLGYKTPRYLSSKCAKGEIPSTKIGTVWLIPESVVLELDRQEVKGQGNRGVARK